MQTKETEVVAPVEFRLRQRAPWWYVDKERNEDTANPTRTETRVVTESAAKLLDDYAQSRRRLRPYGRYETPVWFDCTVFTKEPKRFRLFLRYVRTCFPDTGCELAVYECQFRPGETREVQLCAMGLQGLDIPRLANLWIELRTTFKNY